jgi:hypothetical protein
VTGRIAVLVAEMIGDLDIQRAFQDRFEPPRDVRRLHFLGTAQDASRPPWNGKSCADLTFERGLGEHDWRVRVAVDPDFPLVP